MAVTLQNVGKIVTLILSALLLLNYLHLAAKWTRLISTQNKNDAELQIEWYKYWTPVTPYTLHSIIWAPICLFNIATHVHIIAMAFRKFPDGTSQFFDTDLISWRFIVSQYVANAVQIVPLFYSLYSLPYLYAQEVCSYISVLLFIVSWICIARDFQCEKQKLIENNNKVDLWFHRIVIHNAAGLSFAWGFLKMTIYSLIVVVYPLGHSLATWSAITQTFLGAAFVAYAVVDVGLLDKHQRYLVAPYLVAAVSQLGITLENTPLHVRGNSTIIRILSSILFAICIILLLVKVIVIIVRELKHVPLDEEDKSGNERVLNP